MVISLQEARKSKLGKSNFEKKYKKRKERRPFSFGIKTISFLKTILCYFVRSIGLLQARLPFSSTRRMRMNLCGRGKFRLMVYSA